MITKLVISGSVVECIKCPDCNIKALSKAIDDSVVSSLDSSVIYSSKASLARSYTRLRRLLYANFNAFRKSNGEVVPVQFLTFTFGDNIRDLKIANKEFTLMISRLCYALKISRRTLAYVAVPEFQERGAVHYHVLFFNLPFIHGSDLNRFYSDVWGKGFVFRETVNFNDQHDVVKYMGKYLTKGEKHFINKKRFFSSRACIRPFVIDSPVLYHLFFSLYSSTLFHVHSVQIDRDFVGTIYYDVFSIHNDYLSSFLRRYDVYCERFRSVAQSVFIKWQNYNKILNHDF